MSQSRNKQPLFFIFFAWVLATGAVQLHAEGQAWRENAELAGIPESACFLKSGEGAEFTVIESLGQLERFLTACAKPSDSAGEETLDLYRQTAAARIDFEKENLLLILDASGSKGTAKASLEVSENEGALEVVVSGSAPPKTSGTAVSRFAVILDKDAVDSVHVQGEGGRNFRRIIVAANSL